MVTTWWSSLPLCYIVYTNEMLWSVMSTCGCEDRKKTLLTHTQRYAVLQILLYFLFPEWHLCVLNFICFSTSALNIVNEPIWHHSLFWLLLFCFFKKQTSEVMGGCAWETEEPANSWSNKLSIRKYMLVYHLIYTFLKRASHCIQQDFENSDWHHKLFRKVLLCL